MRRALQIIVLFTSIFAVSIVPVYASVSVTSTVNDGIYVVYDFRNINSTVYDEVKANYQLNFSTAISESIVRNLATQGQTRVQISPTAETNEFDDASKSISISFNIMGADIINHTIDQNTKKEICQINTNWRRFQLKLSSNFSIDFAVLLSKPVAEWQKTNETTYVYESQEVLFEFVLPETATEVDAQGDIITFTYPVSFLDAFINSPFLVLTALIIVIIITLIYRKFR